MYHTVIRGSAKAKRTYLRTRYDFLEWKETNRTRTIIMSSGLLGQGSQRLNWQGFEAHTTQVSVRIPIVAATPEQEENGEGGSLRRGSVKLAKDLHRQGSFSSCEGGSKAGLSITAAANGLYLTLNDRNRYAWTRPLSM